MNYRKQMCYKKSRRSFKTRLDESCCYELNRIMV